MRETDYISLIKVHKFGRASQETVKLLVAYQHESRKE